MGGAAPSRGRSRDTSGKAAFPDEQPCKACDVQRVGEEGGGTGLAGSGGPVPELLGGGRGEGGGREPASEGQTEDDRERRASERGEAWTGGCKSIPYNRILRSAAEGGARFLSGRGRR